MPPGWIAIRICRCATHEELLIMASIVEKESGLPQELRLIAGLYLHRLSIGMRLQADPTVIYGMGDRYDGDIRTVDLRTDGPYNTYTRTGLPPTPIALAAAAVIRATPIRRRPTRCTSSRRPRATAATCFPPPCRSTTPPSPRISPTSAAEPPEDAVR